MASRKVDGPTLAGGDYAVMIFQKSLDGAFVECEEVEATAVEIVEYVRGDVRPDGTYLPDVQVSTTLGTFGH